MRRKILIITISIFLLGIIPNVKAKGFYSSMPNGSYIIGESLYTRATLDDYKGVLKTEYIMNASKTINEDDISSMVIYYKTPRGELTNALTGETVKVSESDLMNNIEYYNGKKIPTLSLDYTTVSGTDNIKYSLAMNNISSYNDLNNIINWDVYGAKEWNGTLDNLPSGVTPSNPTDEDLKLLKSAINSTSSHTYEVTLKKGEYYCYVSYPYISNGDDKLYLTPLDELVIFAGAKVEQKITGNQIELSVTGIDDYKIKSATLYASRNTKTNGSHIEMNDVAELVKDNDEYRKLLSNNFSLLLYSIANEKSIPWGDASNTYYWYIADVYSNLEEKPTSTKVTLGDLGNSEKEKNFYRADLTITSPNILKGREITLKAESKVEGTVYQKQLTSPNEKEMYLIDVINFASALFNSLEGADLGSLIG